MISGHVVCVILEGDIPPTALACSRRSDSGVRREVREREKIIVQSNCGLASK